MPLNRNIKETSVSAFTLPVNTFLESSTDDWKNFDISSRVFLLENQN